MTHTLLTFLGRVTSNSLAAAVGGRASTSAAEPRE